jgi:hypothetical protein
LVQHLSSFNKESKVISEAFKQKLAAHAPLFIWTIRDFPARSQISSQQEYMEGILRMSSYASGKNIKPDEFAHIRQSLIDIFPDRSCYLLPKPVQTEKKISENDFENLSKDFQAKLEDIKV